ncbi:MAG: SCO1664 family protein [Acidimicrobiales bacterium]
MPAHQRPPPAGVVNLLATGDVEVVGQLPWSSNRTFLVVCRHGDEELAGVYKPGRGERHLWDFPPCIYRREVAAFGLSEMLGWGLVPETVERDEAPFGPGSVQRFVEADFSEHHFTLVEDDATHEQLRRICAFDVLANNADRKSGHCLLGADGRIWAIDNGLCFHREPKLRTVIWEFAGERVPDDLLEDIGALDDRLPGPLEELLSPGEVQALRERARHLLHTKRFPVPDPDSHHYPWPLV